MLGTLTKLGPAALLGLLVGIGLVTWIEPDTLGGTGLILVVSVAFMLLVFAAVRALAASASRGKGTGPGRSNPSPPAK